jgi:hypothetical protein
MSPGDQLSPERAVDELIPLFFRATSGRTHELWKSAVVTTVIGSSDNLIPASR